MLTTYNSKDLSMAKVLICLCLGSLICCVSSTSQCADRCSCREETRDDLGTLYSVVCTNEDLVEVPNFKFLESVTRDQRVNLQRNEIHTIRSNAFPYGAKIVSLDLSQNDGLTFDPNALLPLGSTLKQLSLEAIGLTFDDQLFMLNELQKLEELSISHNNRKGYVAGAVEHVTRVLFHDRLGRSLKKLTMSHCGISTLSQRPLDSLVNLEELDLSNNWFTSVPPGISRLKELKKLLLSQCTIKKLNDYDFKTLHKLEELDLSSNDITTIGTEAFDGLKHSLKVLKLSRCNLKGIPSQALYSLEKLKYLDLSENHFQRIPDNSFVGLYCLSELLISSNGLQFESSSFNGQESCIKKLSLERMGLETVPVESLKQLKELQELSLEGNKITTLGEGSFSGIRANRISLANNPLKTIADGAFNGLPAKVSLTLRRTKLEDIEFLMGYPEGAIGSVNLDHVEMTCRCSMKSFLNVTKNVHIFGYCRRDTRVFQFNRDRLEEVIDTACKEEGLNKAPCLGGSSTMLISSLFVAMISMLKVRGLN